MNRLRARRLLIASTLVLAAAAGVMVLADDLSDRVARLRDESEYDLALALLEDHVQRGVALSQPMRWMHAQLVTDPDRFDRMAAELLGAQSPEDSLVQAIVVERAQEQFARGQYVSALEGLQALPPSADDRFPQLGPLRGMAAMAAGQPRDARLFLESVRPDRSTYALAQMLLADLHLRAAQPEDALEHAALALKNEDASVATQALYVRARALEQLGRLDEASEARQRVLRDHPRTVEAAWLRDQPVALAAAAPAAPSVPEVEAPVSRQGYALQFGAFHDRRLALKLATQLTGSVDDLRVERDVESTPTWYRVVGGRFSTLGNAESERDALASRGLSTVVLRPGRGQ
jgi:tetratricopeptide (TPR) repeat protein